MSLAPRRGAGAGAGGGAGFASASSSSSSRGSSSLASRPEWVGAADDTVAVMDRGNQSMIRMSASAQDHVNAYLEYDRIVGDADGGVMLSEEAYAEFKANAIAHRANRIYVSWRCMKTGIDCRMVGPSSPCFCTHRFKQHATDNHNKKMHCRQPGCPCSQYSYIPIRGTQDVKCLCKHSYDVHHVTKLRKCKNGGCPCTGFSSSLSCSCREQYGAHETVFETKEERQAAGRPVDNLAGGGQGYEALGGLTSFSSLVDGIDRLALGAGETSYGGAIQQDDAPPPRAAKLKAEEEFALYEAKYKSSSKSGSSGGAGRSSAPASSSSSMAAAARRRTAEAGQYSQPDPYAQPALPSGGGGGGGGGGDALNLFLTPHSLSSSASAALPSGSAAPPPRARLTTTSSSVAASSNSIAPPPSRRLTSGVSGAAAGGRLR